VLLLFGGFALISLVLLGVADGGGSPAGSVWIDGRGCSLLNGGPIFER
jgi:hypothetical protein